MTAYKKKDEFKKKNYQKSLMHKIKQRQQYTVYTKKGHYLYANITVPHIRTIY